jgi:hypothetical protein
MVFMEETPDRVVGLLNDLIQTDQDALEAYRNAATRLDDANDRRDMEDLIRGTENRLDRLGTWVTRLGGSTPSRRNFEAKLAGGVVAASAWLGHRALWGSVLAMVDRALQHYQRAVTHQGSPPEVMRLLQEGLDDQTAQRAWLQKRLATA